MTFEDFVTKVHETIGKNINNQESIKDHMDKFDPEILNIAKNKEINFLEGEENLLELVAYTYLCSIDPEGNFQSEKLAYIIWYSMTYAAYLAFTNKLIVELPEKELN